MTPNRTLDIGIDLDGVVYSFVDAMRASVHAETGRPLASMPAATCWHFYDTDWGMELSEFLAHFKTGINNGHIFAVGEPIPGAIDGLTALAAAGHRLHLITDRGAPGDPAIALASTRAWLAEHSVPHTSLTISADKTVVPNLATFLDDRVENYEALEAAGMNPFLMDTSTNQGYPARRATWAQFVSQVAALAA